MNLRYTLLFVCTSMFITLAYHPIYAQDAETATIYQSSSGFELVPNPASNLVKLKFNSGREQFQVIQIFDLVGEQVYQSAISLFNKDVTIDVTQFEKGVYVVQISGPLNRSTRKLIIR